MQAGSGQEKGVVNLALTFMRYSGQTLFILETDQRSSGIDSNRAGIKPNADGSYTIFVGPKAPKGWENNWTRLSPARAST